MRLSLGASRGRVVRQLLTESLILGTLAAALGLVLAPIASELLVRMTVGVQSGPLPFSVAIDWRVLAYTALVSLATSALFGVAPAWHATDVALADALKASARNVPRGGRGRLSRALVVLQVALSLLLVVAAGLFLRSLQNLQAAPLGLEATHVVSASINPVLDAAFGGWELNSIITANTGTPLDVSYSPSAANDVTGLTNDYRGEAILRPNISGSSISQSR